MNFYIGQSFSLTQEISLELISSYAKLTGDFNEIHTSERFAQEKGFRTIVSHGLLTSSFFSTISGMHLPGKDSLLMNVEFHFTAPVYAGDKITYEVEVTGINEEFKFLELSARCLNQRGEQILRGKLRSSYKVSKD